MKYETFRSVYPLTGEAVDQIAAKVEEYLLFLRTERTNILRIRLSLEEALLRWQDRFGTEAEVTVELGKRWFRPTITLALSGAVYDPLDNAEDDLGNWSNSLLSSIGLTPRYTYDNGVNTLQLKLQNPRFNPAITLVCSVLFGIIVGFLGDLLLPETVQASVLLKVLDPMKSVFHRILNTVAGPVVFLSVLSAVCSVGSIGAMGKSGKRLIIRFIFISGLLTLLAAVLTSPLFSLQFLPASLSGTQFSGLLDFFLLIFPNDMLTPLIEGDSPQLILLALVLGYALLAAGTQAGGLRTIVEQAESVGLLIAGWVGRLSPYFVAALLVLEIWNGSAWMILGLWKPLVISFAFSAAMLFLFSLWIRTAHKVPLSVLVRKMKVPFRITLRNASIESGYGANQFCCEKRLGISPRLTEYGLPLGTVVFMPTATMAVIIFTLYAAQSFGVGISITWYIMAILLTVTLQAAAPPVPGVGLLTYTVIFARLGIPSDALAIALAADVLFNFASPAMDQAMLQLDLIEEASRTRTLDEEMLRRPPVEKR